MTDFAHYLDRKGQLIEAVDRLLALVRESKPDAEIQEVQRFRQGLDGELSFKILCVGDFSTGKSTFINRFLLGEDLLPADALPTTAVPTRIRYGERPRAHLYRPDGSVRTVSEGIAAALEDAVSTDGANAEGIVGVIVETPSPRLAAGVEVVDGPGLNDTAIERMSLTLGYLDHADAILFFLKATQPFTGYQRRFFEGDILSRESLSRVFVILNWWDAIPAAQREEVRDFVRSGIERSLNGRGLSVGTGGIEILPVSSKTGENAEAVRERVWDAIGARKFTDVLSIRLHRFNALVERCCRDLDAQLALLARDRRERGRHRATLEQEIADYRIQGEQWRGALARALRPEFLDYRNKLGDVFDQMVADLTSRVAAIADDFSDPKDINTRLASEVMLAQKRAMYRLRDLDEAFLQRVRDLIEREKGQIDAPSAAELTLEEFFLRWPEVAADWQALGGQVAGGVGLGGILLGSAAYLQGLVAAPAVAPTFWGSVTALFGVGAPAAAAPAWVAFGVPGIAVGAIGLFAYWIFREASKGKLRQQLHRLSANLSDEVANRKLELLAGLAARERDRIAMICENVDCEITQTYRAKLAELERIDAITDNGDCLRDLRERIAALTLPVNP